MDEQKDTLDCSSQSSERRTHYKCLIPSHTGKYRIRLVNRYSGKEFYKEHWFFKDENSWHLTGLKPDEPELDENGNEVSCIAEILDVCEEVTPVIVPNKDNNYDQYHELFGAIVRQGYTDYLDNQKRAYDTWFRCKEAKNDIEAEQLQDLVRKYKEKSEECLKTMYAPKHLNEYVTCTIRARIDTDKDFRRQQARCGNKYAIYRTEHSMDKKKAYSNIYEV